MCAENTDYGQKAIRPLNDPEKPLISVIVLTYKDQSGLFRTLDTIFLQDFPNVELIVSDDASGIQNYQEIMEYVQKNKRSNILDFVVLCNDVNIGTVAHANKTACISAGEFIKFLPCGDGLYETTSLKLLYEFAKSHPEPVVTSVAAVCSTDLSSVYYYFPNSRRMRIINSLSPQNLYAKLSVSNIISSAGTLFRRRFFEQSGFDEEYRLLEDWPTWLMLTREGVRIPCLQEITVFYAINGISSKSGTAFDSDALHDDMIKCFDKEILPFILEMSYLKRFFIWYLYKRLKSYSTYSSSEKIIFIMRNLPFEVYRLFKRSIKGFLIQIIGKR